MKKITLSVLSLLVFYSIQAQIVNIPDANFKHILTMENCVDLDNDGTGDSDADTNDDGEIQMSEALAVEHLILNSAMPGMRVVLDVTGLEEFVNLKSFDSENINLSQYQNVGGNFQYVGVETLDFTPFSNLEKVAISDEYSSVLSTIDASGLTNLTDFTAFWVRPEDSFEENQIPVAIDFTGCTNLIDLNVANSLIDIDFCQIPSLETLICWELYPSNADLDFNCLVNLSTLDVSMNILNSLYLKNGSVLNSFIGFDTFGNVLCIDDNQAELDSLGDIPDNFQNVTTTCDTDDGTNIVSGNVLSSISSTNDTCSTNEVINPLHFDVMQNNISVYDFLSTEADTYETPIGLSQGDYVIVPTVIFTDGLVVNPTQIDVAFDENNAEMVQQDLCMEPRIEVVDGIEIEFFPNNIPGDPALLRFDAYIILTNTTNTDYNGELRLEFDGDYTSPFDYDLNPNSELDDEVIWDSVNIVANSDLAIWLRIGYNSDTDPNFPVMAGDQLIYDLFLTDLGSGGRSVAGDPVPDFRMIETIMPGEPTLSVDGFDGQNPDIMVYPNPTNGIVNIKHNETINEVSMFSMNGQLVYSKTKPIDSSEAIEIDMSNLNQGIYFISVKTNSSVYTKKVIKR